MHVCSQLNPRKLAEVKWFVFEPNFENQVLFLLRQMSWNDLSLFYAWLVTLFWLKFMVYVFIWNVAVLGLGD